MSATRPHGASEDTGRTALLMVAALTAVALMWMLRSIVMMVAFSTMLAYALDPLVSRVTRIPLPRGARIPQALAAGLVMMALVTIAIWSTVVVAPQLLSEAASLFTGLPERMQSLVSQFSQIATHAGYGSAVGPALQHVDDALPTIQSWLLRWIGRMFSNVVQLASAVVVPVLAFYLLAERGAVRASWMRFIPAEAHPRLEKVGQAIDRALASYVRGQAVVCLVSGAAMTVALTAMGLSHALLLGFLVAVAEILPFLGFWFAAVAIGLVGLGEGPMRAALALVTYVVSNALIGLLVTPRVMGRHLKMHPFVVTVSVLAGGELLGPPGVLLALPAAAIAQSLVQTFTAPPPRESRRGAA